MSKSSAKTGKTKRAPAVTHTPRTDLLLDHLMTLGCQLARQADHGTRAVLHTLRDRLTSTRLLGLFRELFPKQQ